jgi:hypothetical protein
LRREVFTLAGAPGDDIVLGDDDEDDNEDGRALPSPPKRQRLANGAAGSSAADDAAAVAPSRPAKPVRSLSRDLPDWLASVGVEASASASAGPAAVVKKEGAGSGSAAGSSPALSTLLAAVSRESVLALLRSHGRANAATLRQLLLSQFAGGGAVASGSAGAATAQLDSALRAVLDELREDAYVYVTGREPDTVFVPM